MPLPSALVLDTASQPFDDPDRIFKIKHDDFRALAVLDGPIAQFVSRQGHRLTAFGEQVEPKKILKSPPSVLIPRAFCDYLAAHGTALFRLACQHDPEGIVAKRADSPYAMAGRKSPWRKIKNPNYSQREGRGEWFDMAKFRLADPTGRRHVPTSAGRKKAERRRV